MGRSKSSDKKILKQTKADFAKASEEIMMQSQEIFGTPSLLSRGVDSKTKHEWDKKGIRAWG